MTTLEFLRDNGLTPGVADFKHWAAEFQREMAAGLAGEKSSLRMIPAFLSAQALPHSGEPVIVLDAGGTNLRIALMEFTDQGPKAEYFNTVPMLGTQGRLTIEEFYDRLAELMAPIADRSGRIGFCFSFPCQILPDLDGKVLHFDKEVSVSGAEGSVLGVGLRAALKKLGKRHDHRVAVINDTVAAMLGAMSQGLGDSRSMGFILGTGTNICASFPTDAIGKLPASLRQRGGSMVVNLESGGFDALERSAVDLAFDATQADPGTQVLEKLISGAYQGPMALAYLRAAAIEGLLTPAGTAGFEALPSLTAKDISDFLNGGSETPLAFLNEADKAVTLDILDGFFRRAARLTAATLAAVLEACGDAKDPAKPVSIAAEGTTFYKCPLLHKYLLEDMETLVAQGMGLYSKFVQGENPNLTGAALAALG